MKENVAKVDNHLYIGNCHACKNIDDSFFKVHIVRSDHQNCEFAKLNYELSHKHGEVIDIDNGIFLVWDEGALPATSEMILTALKKISGKKVFIHCTAGRHRAVMLSIAHLYYNSGYDFLDAICRVNSARKNYQEQTVSAIHPQELRLIRDLKKNH